MASLRSAAAVVITAVTAALVACGGDDTPTEPAGADAGDDRSAPPAPEAGASSSTSAGGPVVDCVLGAAIEGEPNDTAAAANPFTELSFCGVISPGTDVDYATFETPPGQTLSYFQAVINGKVDFELTVAGKTFGPADTDQFVPGKYTVKAFTTDKKPGNYRMRLQFDPK